MSERKLSASKWFFPRLAVLNVNERTANWEDIRCPSSKLVPCLHSILMGGTLTKREGLSPPRGHLRLLAWERQRAGTPLNGLTGSWIQQGRRLAPNQSVLRVRIVAPSEASSHDERRRYEAQRRASYDSAVDRGFCGDLGVFFGSVYDGVHPNGFVGLC